MSTPNLRTQTSTGRNSSEKEHIFRKCFWPSTNNRGTGRFDVKPEASERTCVADKCYLLCFIWMIGQYQVYDRQVWGYKAHVCPATWVFPPQCMCNASSLPGLAHASEHSPSEGARPRGWMSQKAVEHQHDSTLGDLEEGKAHLLQSSSSGKCYRLVCGAKVVIATKSSTEDLLSSFCI